MKLPKEAVNEFKKIYKDKIGENLTYTEAEKKAYNFLRLMVLITSPPKNENEKLYTNTK